MTRSSSESNNYHCFDVVMQISVIAKFLPQMKYDMRIFGIIIHCKVTGTTHATVLPTLLIEGPSSFQLEVGEN